MTTKTIQIGIDLGTTNSSIAINDKGKISIIKNIFQEEFTPSVFGYDRAGNKIVGKKAYEKLFHFSNDKEQENYKAEVKRLMGTSKKINFPIVKEKLSAEEISAEILKNLKETLLKKYPDFPTNAVVITVPAYFSIIESEATKRAGNLAGFDYVVLLQEPIAAALAYGFDNNVDENWLVYDLGGGTFDVAVIASKDGNLSVKSHNGNNFLGGKDFDEFIVEKVIVPAILQKYDLKNFSSSNPKYKSVFARLKGLAEEAKKYLSQDQETEIVVEGLSALKEEDIFLTINFSRKNFEELIASLISETIDLAMEAISESGMSLSSIKRIILVGGSTQIPYIRERLEKDLKIKVDSSVDPLTVVAQGAAIYGASQRIPEKLQKKKENSDKETLDLTLYYEPVSSDIEQMVTGSFEELKESDNNYYVQIQSESGVYTSSRKKIKNGKFYETVSLEIRKQNVFWIYLFDEKGNTIKITPDSFVITQGMTITGAPIAHTIGVSIAKKDVNNNFNYKNIFESFFEKNSILPLQKTKTYYTTKRLKKGDTENTLPIRILEGESSNPENNIFICDLSMTGETIPFDLPEKTAVDITIEVNESREVIVSANIPSIEQSFSVRSTIADEDIDTDKLEEDYRVQKQKYKTISNLVPIEEKKKIENKLEAISNSLGSASLDEDAKRKANKKLKDLKQLLEELDKEKELPQLITEFNNYHEAITKIINGINNLAVKTKSEEQINIIKTDADNAIKQGDKTLLIQARNQLFSLGINILQTTASYWIDHYYKLAKGTFNFSNPDEATYYFNKGKKAIDTNDKEELERCVRNLWALLPPEEQNQMQGSISGITDKE